MPASCHCCRGSRIREQGSPAMTPILALAADPGEPLGCNASTPRWEAGGLTTGRISATSNCRTLDETQARPEPDAVWRACRPHPASIGPV